jgi:hypothetical protein
MSMSRYKTKLLGVFFHTVLLVAATILLQNTSFIRFDEINFLKWAAIIKHDIFRADPKPLWKNAVFIDVSKDLALADDDAYGPPDSAMQGAQRVITDRVKLAGLFAILNRHQGAYRYIICDVLFDKAGPGDDILKPQIEKLGNVIVSAIIDQGKLVRPIYKSKWAVVNYTAINKSIFTKMPVYANDSLKSLPVMLYESMTTGRFVKKGPLTLLNGTLSFNTVIPELYYRNADLIRPEAGKNFNTFYLGELLADPDCFSVLKDKYIIIGNFEDDVHTTYLGRLPGSLILWDTYLTLYRQRLAIPLSWVLLLFVFYFLVSYWIILHPEKKFRAIHQKIRVPFMSKFIISYISYVGLLMLINLISFYFFGTFVSLFYIATYLSLIEVMIEQFPAWRKNLYEYIMTF